MSLRNDGSELFDFHGNMITPSNVMFANAERRLAQKKQDLEDMQNEYNLLENQAFNLYRNQIEYWKLDKSLIESASNWLSMQKSGKDSEGNKLDGRKKYKEKDCAEYLFNYIENLLGIDDMEVIQIMDFNFGEARDIVFTSHNHKWELTVPMIHGIRIDSYKRYGASTFKLKLRHYDSEHCTGLIGSTFLEEELNDIMKTGINKYCKGE